MFMTLTVLGFYGPSGVLHRYPTPAVTTINFDRVVMIADAEDNGSAIEFDCRRPSLLLEVNRMSLAGQLGAK